VIEAATPAAPSVEPEASGAVKIVWPTLIPGVVNATQINVNAVALVADSGNQDFIIGGDFRGANVTSISPATPRKS